MPQKPTTFCSNFPQCRNRSASGRCSSCRREYERNRGSASQRGYDREWQRIATSYLERHPICEHEDGCDELATDVHHKDGAGPKGDNSDDNLQALCHSHHSVTTAREHRFGRSASGAGTCVKCGDPVTNRKSLKDGVCPVCRARPYEAADQTTGVLQNEHLVKSFAITYGQFKAMTA